MPWWTRMTDFDCLAKHYCALTKVTSSGSTPNPTHPSRHIIPGGGAATRLSNYARKRGASNSEKVETDWAASVFSGIGKQVGEWSDDKSYYCNPRRFHSGIHPPTPWHREWASTVELIRGYHGVRIRWPWIGRSVWVVRKGISRSSNKIVSIVFNYSNRISDRKEICTLNDADRVEDLDL